jgi:inorganic pyrophosphatase
VDLSRNPVGVARSWDVHAVIGIPQTLAESGDPGDVSVVGRVPVVPGAVIRCRPSGALIMRDERGGDERVVAVPVGERHPFESGVRSRHDLPPILTEQIAHCFQHNQELETGRWVTISRRDGPHGAAQLMRSEIARAQGVTVKPRPAATEARARRRARRASPRRARP